MQIRIAPKKVRPEVNDVDLGKESPQLEEGTDGRAYATVEQIESQKLPPEEILSLPMFKVLTFSMYAQYLSNIYEWSVMVSYFIDCYPQETNFRPCVSIALILANDYHKFDKRKRGR